MKRNAMVEKFIDRLVAESDLAWALVVTVVLVYLRILVDKPTTAPIRIFVEALTCGVLTLAAWFLITALEYDARICVFIGACIGYIGPTSIRLLAIKYLDKRL